QPGLRLVAAGVGDPVHLPAPPALGARDLDAAPVEQPVERALDAAGGRRVEERDPGLEGLHEVVQALRADEQQTEDHVRHASSLDALTLVDMSSRHIYERGGDARATRAGGIRGRRGPGPDTEQAGASPATQGPAAPAGAGRD